MSKKYIGRVSEIIRINLCALLESKIDDPRLLGVTITGIKVTPDTKRADVYFSILGDEQTKQDALQALQGAAGWLRREIGARTRLRNTPEFVFHWDPSLEHGERIDQLLEQLDLDSNRDE